MPASMYSKDEKILCFHHEVLYDAKILEVRQSDPADKKSPMEYRVHYKGWKNTWDEWVIDDRLRKATEENRELASNIRRQAEESVRSKNSKSVPKRRGTSERDSVRDSEERGASVSRGNKRARGDNDLETEEQFHRRASVPIPLSDNLKSLIVDDWERVSKNCTIVSLPAPRPVRQIFNEYKEEEKSKRAGNRLDLDILHEVISGLSEYFDTMLDKILLFRYERPQYYALRKRHLTEEDQGPVAVYGAEHLLRMISLLPEIVAQTNITQPNLNRLREEIIKLSLWLSKNSERYFRTEYISADEFK